MFDKLRSAFSNAAKSFGEKELKEKDIIDLNEKYKSLFNEYNFNQKGAYIQIKNDKKSITIAEIFHTINKVA